MRRAAVFKQAHCENPKSIGKKHGKNKKPRPHRFQADRAVFQSKKEKAGFRTCLFGLDIHFDGDVIPPANSHFCRVSTQECFCIADSQNKVKPKGIA